jgi:porin
MYASGGVGGRGFVPSRPYDRMGVGFYWLDMSSDLDDFAINKLEDELGIEAFYNIALTPWLQLSVDFQWIDTGVVENDNAVVLGTRIFTIF